VAYNVLIDDEENVQIEEVEEETVLNSQEITLQYQ